MYLPAQPDCKVLDTRLLPVVPLRRPDPMAGVFPPVWLTTGEMPID
jgi:hypothetical protein